MSSQAAILHFDRQILHPERRLATDFDPIEPKELRTAAPMAWNSPVDNDLDVRIPSSEPENVLTSSCDDCDWFEPVDAPESLGA